MTDIFEIAKEYATAHDNISGVTAVTDILQRFIDAWDEEDSFSTNVLSDELHDAIKEIRVWLAGR